MAKEFKYDIEGMRDVASKVRQIHINLEQLKREFNGAQELISGMKTLGFLDKKKDKLNKIHDNTFAKLSVELESFEKMVKKNANDVEATDINIANKMKEK